MKRLASAAALVAGLWAGTVLAQDEGHGAPAPEHGAPAAHGAAHGGGSKQAETSEFILHHVADNEEFELEIPVPPYHLVTIPIASWFPFLLIESVPGACSQPVRPGFESFPSLGAFLGGCYDLRPTKAILMLWMATGLLFLILAVARKRDANGVPRSMATHLVEVLALFVRDEVVVPNLGKEEAPRYVPYLTSLFFFVLAVNWLGLIPGMFAGTGVITVTAALAIFTFLLTQAAAIRAAGVGGYFAHLTGGVHPALWPIMIPVEVLGLFTKPFALLVRLFANMLGGHMVIFFLLSLIFVWSAVAAVISVPLTIAIYMLEMFVGILQAYLFTLLTALFIGQGVAMGHHTHAHEGEHGHEH
jgi:F-type H+-transporting ATPase subunit a